VPPPRHCSLNLFTKSREITLQIFDKFTSKTPGANLKYAEQPALLRFNDYVKSKLKIAKKESEGQKL
jgi:hypothetical protein